MRSAQLLWSVAMPMTQVLPEKVLIKMLTMFQSVDICIGSVSGTVNVYVNISEIVQGGGQCCCDNDGQHGGSGKHTN